MDFLTYNPLADLKRRATRRGQRKREAAQSAIQPTLDTSSGIIAIRYTDTLESSATSTPSSEKSENSFDGLSDSPAATVTASRPGLPKRSASRRTATRPVTPSEAIIRNVNVDVDAPPPPIPPKSPYRASRLMVQLQHELAETPEYEFEGAEEERGRSFYFDEDDNHSSDRWSVQTV